MPAVSFQSVNKAYTSAKGSFQALRDVSFDIEEGEFFGLLGPNGAGKTTLISILAGLNRASAGRVLVRGHDVNTQAAQARQLLGVVPQELVFDPFFSVREALRFQSGYFGVTDNGAWIDELLEGLGLAAPAAPGEWRFRRTEPALVSTRRGRVPPRSGSGRRCGEDRASRGRGSGRC